MRCPFCGNNKDKVIDSRAVDSGRVIRRRRECLSCEKRFTTREFVEATLKLMVIKKDGTRVPYDRQKLLAGMEQACYKRPVAAETLVNMVEQIEDQLQRRGDREVEAIEIGKLAAHQLKGVDNVAYVRFASVYKQFRDVDDFIDEIRESFDADDADSPDQGQLFP